MNRDGEREETKEPTVSVSVDVSAQFMFKSGTSGAFNFGFSYAEVPVSADDKAIEGSVINEIEKLYKAGGTIRVANANKKTCLVDAENIDYITIEEVKITRGEADE